ncbi:DUF262 domain-containing protein [Streptomyces sp. ODS28]|uniref:GmrSD restriction endonuclease domain-containing protein n=1 Tax=Streptomyces sp. ODS28 TaxID=3136688 RepID=UPI0031EAEF22
MKADEMCLAGLMQRNQQFQIPLYQRTYSWTTKQLAQLWSDILDQARLLEEDRKGTKGTTHFLGSLVFAPSPHTEVAFPRYIVVDGQQRLTTLSLALAAIRDHLADRDPGARKRIDDKYLVNKENGGVDHFRLLPTQADREHYAEFVRGTHAGGGGSDGIGGTYRFFRTKLVEAEEDPAEPYDIARIEQAIVSRLTFVAITAGQDDNVHRIFASLNNTGLKLSQADLLRNYLFMKLGHRGEFVYETYWLPLQNMFSNENLEHLMWLQLVLGGDDRVRRQDLYAAQQARFEGEGADEAAVEAYVGELYRRAAFLKRILTPETEEDPEVRAGLRRLREWQASVAHPVVMLLLEMREAGTADSAEVARGLSYVESFLVRRMICWIPTNNLNRIFQAAPGQLPRDAGPADGLRQLLSAERRFWPGDEDLRDQMRRGRFYQRGRAHQRSFVLRRLEESHDHPEPVDFERAGLTVEHVMPQSAGREWLEGLAAECDEGETPEDLHARLVHTVGNPTLTAVNSQLSNNPFDRKKDLFAASHLELNRSIAATDRWGAAEIQARADELAQRAIELWPAPVTRVSRVERGRDWEHLHQVLAALPDGMWTTYGDLAALVGSSAQAVGRHLVHTKGVFNAHRVLTAEGRVPEGFRWLDGSDADVYGLLAKEGVEFTDAGTALPSQRLTAEDLSALAGVQGSEELDEGDRRLSADAEAGPADGWEQRRARFRRQLEADNGEEETAAVRELLGFWESAGGSVGYGFGKTYVSASLMLDRPRTGEIWPLSIVPGTGRGGGLEIVFQHLAAREPFTDPALREDLRQRLNRMRGVGIPEGKLALRPTVPLTVLADEGNRRVLLETLAWFRDRAVATD